MSDINQCVIVGIAGASASGKSLIASTIYNELREKVGDHQIGVITEDCYYNDQSHLSMEERVKTNYDHPSALDHDLLCDHLEKLVRGEAVEVPEYSYADHTRTATTTLMTPKKVIILEVFCCLRILACAILCTRLYLWIRHWTSVYCVA
ncbi:Cytidine monophosphokinase [Vibrio sp. B1REV9]|nr:Cytidine monophosphokinase [Vibrio sp. B1REV9]